VTTVEFGGWATVVQRQGQARHHNGQHPGVDRFCHQALFYAGTEDFLEATGSFVEAGLSAGEPVMVTLCPEKIELLRSRLGSGADQVVFVDMAEMGRNPARIIPAWRRFVDHHPDSPTLWGIGEPIWPARRPDEITECQRAEALFNIAFSGDRPWRLTCLYDTTALTDEVLCEARRSHPYVLEQGRQNSSALYDDSPSVFAGPLPEPATVVGEHRFDAASLGSLRADLSRWVSTVLSGPRAAYLVLAANEVATNSVRHGGGSGRLRYWRDGAAAVVEVIDAGSFVDPLLGRVFPPDDDEDGRGLWMANQLCDLVQLRSSPAGTVVRLRMEG
jgi:anti-sigma regulatory factor (Ser/Thr protein kinase)